MPRRNKTFDLKTYLGVSRHLVDEKLVAYLKRNPAPNQILAAMRYSLMAGGKRIRPVLCLAAAEAVGGPKVVHAALPAACAIEMIHTYSLIHDDLPALDDDELRRGRPTSHIAFNEATAILAGDALLTMAFQVLSENAGSERQLAKQQLRVINIISKAAGPWGMIEGQMRDLAAEGQLLSLDALEAMHMLKTGALIEAAVHCGAIAGGASTTQIDRLCSYAKHIGLAFQVTDDILNVDGDPDLLGKSVGTDQLRRKSTYPSLMGIEASQQKAEIYISNALQALDIFDNRADALRAVAIFIRDRRH